MVAQRLGDLPGGFPIIVVGAKPFLLSGWQGMTLRLMQVTMLGKSASGSMDIQVLWDAGKHPLLAGSAF
jgi:hypothetical protein